MSDPKLEGRSGASVLNLAYNRVPYYSYELSTVSEPASLKGSLNFVQLIYLLVRTLLSLFLSFSLSLLVRYLKLFYFPDTGINSINGVALYATSCHY